MIMRVPCIPVPMQVRPAAKVGSNALGLFLQQLRRLWPSCPGSVILTVVCKKYRWKEQVCRRVKGAALPGTNPIRERGKAWRV